MNTQFDVLKLHFLRSYIFMDNKFLKFSAVFVCLTVFNTASAENFVGLEWGANEDWRPNFVIGYKQNDDESKGSDDVDVDGWGTSLSFGWEGIERVKIFKIHGISYVQAELGFGFNLIDSVPLLNIGLQSKSFTADMDLLFDGGYRSHLGFNTVGEYK